MMIKYNKSYLRNLRQSHRMSRKQLADKLGISERQLIRLESVNNNDFSYLKIELIEKLSQIFDDFNITELFKKED